MFDPRCIIQLNTNINGYLDTLSFIAEDLLLQIVSEISRAVFPYFLAACCGCPVLFFSASRFRCTATILFTFSLQAVTNINTLLDKADRVYHQLMGHRPQLESLLSKVNEAAPEKPQVSFD